MSAQPTGDPGPDEPYEVIHLGGQAAAIEVPVPALTFHCARVSAPVYALGNTIQRMTQSTG